MPGHDRRLPKRPTFGDHRIRHRRRRTRIAGDRGTPRSLRAPSHHRRGPDDTTSARRDRVHHLHVRIHRAPQRCPGQPPKRPDSDGQHRPDVRVRRHGRVDHVPLVRIRLLRLGAVGAAATRGPAGRRRLLHDQITGHVPRTAPQGASDGAEPNTHRLLPTRRSRPCVLTERHGSRPCTALRRLRWRSARPRAVTQVVRQAGRHGSDVGQHVRDHRDDSARQSNRTRPQRQRARVGEHHRASSTGIVRLRTRSATELGTTRCRRRNVRRR